MKNIDEAIAFAKRKHDFCRKEGYASMATYWGGYVTALQDVKDGKIVVPKESEDKG